MKDRLEEILKEFEDDLEDAIGVEKHTITYQITEAIIKEIALKYAREMCELQKEECCNNANLNTINLMKLSTEGGVNLKNKALESKDNKLVYLICDKEPYVFTVNKNSILSSKNVCDT